MSFYNGSDSKFSRNYCEEVEMVFSAIDCLLHRGHVIYCSSELSSGLRLFDALRRHSVKTPAELKEQLGEAWYQANIWNVNVRSGIVFAEAVRAAFPDGTIAITPAPFSAPGWSQPEYLYFWEMLLRTRIKSVWFNRNWQFSNGCTFEFAVAHDAGLPTFDHNGQILTRSAGTEMICVAVEQLERQGFDTSKLRANVELLHPKPAEMR
jgi:hypothetical protein